MSNKMIQSVDRAVRILLALQDERLLGVSELADRLGLAKGTVHGLIQTLASHSMVQRDSASGKYMLGPALLVMGNVYLNAHELRVRSLRWVTSLGASTGRAVRVGVLVWPHVVVVHHLAVPGTAVPISEVGLGMPAHATALGKAILAFRPDRAGLVGKAPLPRLTGSTITRPAALLAQLEETAVSGVAVDRQEAVVGEIGVAGAVFDRGGAVTGSVAVVLADAEPDEGVVAAVRETARGISREMGAPAWPVTS